MSINHMFRTMSIDNSLVKEVNDRRKNKVNKHKQIKKILSNITYYNIIGVIFFGSTRHNEISKSLNQKYTNNINVPLSLLSGGFVDSKIRLTFLKKRKISHKNRVYEIDYNGILRFIGNHMLGTPFIFKRGVPKNIEKGFKKFFKMYFPKYYSLNQVINHFIFYYAMLPNDKLVLKTENLFFPIWLREEIVKSRWEEVIKKYQKELSKEKLFQLSCYSYVQEKMIIL